MARANPRPGVKTCVLASRSRSLRSSTSERLLVEGARAGDVAAEDQRMHIIGALVGIHGFEVQPVPDDRRFQTSHWIKRERFNRHLPRYRTPPPHPPRAPASASPESKAKKKRTSKKFMC